MQQHVAVQHHLTNLNAAQKETFVFHLANVCFDKFIELKGKKEKRTKRKVDRVGERVKSGWKKQTRCIKGEMRKTANVSGWIGCASPSEWIKGNCTVRF